MGLVHILKVTREDELVRAEAAFHVPVTGEETQAAVSARQAGSVVAGLTEGELQQARAGQVLEVVRTLQLPAEMDRQQIKDALAAAYQQVQESLGPRLLATIVEEASLAGAVWDGQAWSR